MSSRNNNSIVKTSTNSDGILRIILNNPKNHNALSEDISWLQSFKKEIIIVSSGAIALGRSSFGAENKTLNLEENQAAAAIGQIELAYSWKAALEKFNLKCAQILLSPDDTETRRKHLNARATIAKLIEANIIA